MVSRHKAKPLLRGGHTAVNEQDLSGDEIGGWRREEYGRANDVEWLAYP
jgi:hypothetical protein